MQASLKIATLKRKIEVMIEAFDGPPDTDALEVKRLEEGQEFIENEIKTNLRECSEKLQERNNNQSPEWHQSDDRVKLDDEIKKIFDDCDMKLADLRTIFKEYQSRMKHKMPELVILKKSKRIDILRSQVNLLKDEMKSQN